METWEEKHQRERLELSDWRGRRLRACDAANDLHDIIDALGAEEDSTVIPVGMNERWYKRPSDAVRREMHGTVAELLHRILLINDGTRQRF